MHYYHIILLNYLSLYYIDRELYNVTVIMILSCCKSFQDLENFTLILIVEHKYFPNNHVMYMYKKLCQKNWVTCRI